MGVDGKHRIPLRSLLRVEKLGASISSARHYGVTRVSRDVRRGRVSQSSVSSGPGKCGKRGLSVLPFFLPPLLPPKCLEEDDRFRRARSETKMLTWTTACRPTPTPK